MVLITSGAQAQRACASACQSSERRNIDGLCIPDQPLPPPAWAAKLPANLGTPPPASQPGVLPTCGAGQMLFAGFVNGVLSNTCVTQCAESEKMGAQGTCVPRCTAPDKWDQPSHSDVPPFFSSTGL